MVDQEQEIKRLKKIIEYYEKGLCYDEIQRFCLHCGVDVEYKFCDDCVKNEEILNKYRKKGDKYCPTCQDVLTLKVVTFLDCRGCDECEESIVPDDPNGTDNVLQCEMCDYDLCSKCA